MMDGITTKTLRDENVRMFVETVITKLRLFVDLRVNAVWARWEDDRLYRDWCGGWKTVNCNSLVI